MKNFDDIGLAHRVKYNGMLSVKPSWQCFGQVARALDVMDALGSLHEMILDQAEKLLTAEKTGEYHGND